VQTCALPIFRKMANTPGFNTHSRGADVEIEFALAVINPQGQEMPEPGINRINGGRSSWTRDQIENLKTYTIWDPTLYYNIWVLDIASSGSTQLLGYAQFPIQSGLPGLSEGGAATTDGVVVHVDRKSTRLNSSHVKISYAVFCL